MTVNDLKKMTAQMNRNFDNGNSAFPHSILPNGILTIEALKKLTAGPLTVKMNRPAATGSVKTPVSPLNVLPPIRNPVMVPESLSPRPDPRPMDLSLLSTGFSSFLKKVEGQDLKVTTRPDPTSPTGHKSPIKTIFPPSPVTSEEFCCNSVSVSSISPQKPINRSLSEIEKNQIIEVTEISQDTVKSETSKRNRRKQGELFLGSKFIFRVMVFHLAKNFSP